MILSEIITAPRFRGGLFVWIDEDKIVKIKDLPQTMTDQQFVNLVYGTHEKMRRFPKNPNDRLNPHAVQAYEQDWKSERDMVTQWLDDKLNAQHQPIIVTDDDLKEYWVRRELTKAPTITIQQYIEHITDPEHHYPNYFK